MGYYVHQADARFRIKRENIPAALDAIKKLFEPDREEEQRPRYAWVDEDCAKASTLEEALEFWGIEAHLDDNGDVDEVIRGREKLGDELTLFTVLAPFVEHESYIEFVGEDDNRWRWVFLWGECREEYPSIVWPYMNNLPMRELVRASGEGTP